MDIKTQIFTAISQALSSNQASFQAQNITPIASFDIDTGQIENPERFEVYPTPCVFLKQSREPVGNRVFRQTIQLTICLDLPHYNSTGGGILTGAEVPLFLYKYQNVVRTIVEDIEDLDIRFVSDSEEGVEGVFFTATQTYSLEYEEVEDDGREEIEVDAGIKILLNAIKLVEKV